MGIVLLVVSVVAVVFASIWAYQGWGVGPCVAVAVVGGLVVLFVPFGAIIGLIAGLVIISLAQKAKFRRVADGEEDFPMGTAFAGATGYPHPAPGPGAESGMVRPDGPQLDSPPCPTCQTPGMHWVNQYQRWFCTQCKDYR
jgi:hypothetical protein